ncbi:carbohydrate kinase family protein [Methylonatrum kenyense]|uniref:carbohydrate kinase family protein n=1 Tax=Methylonatrum kenyense TaxID=455253 RepID=UPI0020BF315B|nr:carbohydrate kinase family protein [Methylonatrum kenyense]MCK8516573.1 carbohydrate kinase family protein [Methylonatrum kenyense]
MPALISGSIAYDTIMVFRDRFKNHVLPDQVHILNLAFLVDDMRKEFGGCAGNIAYNMRLLGDEGICLATVGRDFPAYREWMDRWQIPRDHVLELDQHYTAQAYITTDLDDNQITAFHPGAMNQAHQVHVPADSGARLGVLAPNGRDGMLQHAREFREAGLPFIFDPGQGLPMFQDEELRHFMEQATWLAVNDYESELLQQRTGLSLEQMAARVEALVVTRGAHGSRIYTGGRCLEIPAATASAVNDPTGCGDAYRAGLIHGLLHDLDWELTGRIASLMGSIKIAHHGTQNHHFSREQFAAAYQRAYATPLPDAAFG